MQKEVKKSWALFIGIGVMMIAHGLQMQIMGIRSVLEDFSVFTTGIFMSGYYVGYFVGSRTTPNFVQKVGHIRVFAAFASLASLRSSRIDSNSDDSMPRTTLPNIWINLL